MINPELNNKIVIYETPNKEIRIDVRLENETVWLSQKQMAQLFSKSVPTINEHIKNIFKERELNTHSTIRKFLIVQKEAGRNVERNVEYYNIDVVISVGYRVKSVIGTQFRIWASKVLKEYLLKGYALNEKKLLETQNKFKELQTTISFIEEKSNKGLLSGQEGELLHLLSIYAKTLTLLEAYDNGKVLRTKGTTTKFLLTYKSCLQIIIEIKKVLVNKKEAGSLFGSEREHIFEGIIKALYQTYDKKELYPNIEDKAANLLYLIIKDHPFADGNKRTAAFLFVYFLDKTDTLHRENGEKKINDNALTALALLVAESNPNEKDIMINIIKNLISN
jgi:prophage maintenance system killer protein